MTNIQLTMEANFKFLFSDKNFAINNRKQQYNKCRQIFLFILLLAIWYVNLVVVFEHFS